MKITDIVENNISNERFGVSELADEIGMSRSNLLRKLKKISSVSVSQFINQVRLQRSMEMLKQGSLTVSEISYEVGFSSPSYFIKCFRDYYGYPPGEAGKRDVEEDATSQYVEPSQSHQLAAIMFTDIQGYTALMQQDEEKAIIFRNRHREVFNSATKRYNGRILQYYGDGTLSTFSSAIDAVRCGIELQLAYREEPRIPVRVGIHSGDIIFTEDGIVGDGVNIASRIESLAIPQSVLISEKVYDEVKNQSSIQTTSLGEFEFKNVNKPIEVFAITNPGLVVPEKDEMEGKVSSISKIKGDDKKPLWTRVGMLSIFTIIAAIIIGYLFFISDIFKTESPSYPGVDQSMSKKSIAVLPFRNESNDSSNVYIINGLMEAILTNLQKIKDLRVISRTSSEKYRNTIKSSPEIARELGVAYLIEGSGQKIGDQILLNIQLIDAAGDQHLWSEQYNREVKDIFTLQMEVAKNIAGEIEVFISPEAEERINKPPTDDLVAYDYFLQGLDLFYKGDYENFRESIPFFQKAVDQDPEFARAYAMLTITYYLLDEPLAEKEFTEQISFNADKAILLDAQLPQSLIAMALVYMHSEDYELAIPYFEKALEYNPNYDAAFMFLVDLYVNHLPDTEKYLEYALRGLQVDISAYDSTAKSISFLHISNAFIQSGFVEEAEKYINMSLDYQPDNLYSQYVKAYIDYAKNGDLERSRDMVIAAFRQDTTRLDILNEVAKFYYFLGDYEMAYRYYKPFNDAREAYNLNIYPVENAKIGVVLDKLGLEEESNKYFAKFKNHADNDQSIYKNVNLAMYYSYMGEIDKALEHLELFSEEEHYFYWAVILMDVDPLVDNIKDLPRFKKIKKKIDNKFWDYHNQIRTSLQKKGLI